MDVQKNYREHRDEYAAYERARNRAAGRRAWRAEDQRRYRRRHPEADRARRLAGRALRSGRLLKSACEGCGGEETEMHHEDYARPLDVRWLCRGGHLAEHGKASYR
jgi:hypothetical protein